MKIKKYLRIILIITSMIPLLIASVIFNILFSDQMVSLQMRNLQKMAETNQSGLEAMLHTQETEVSLLATQGELISLAKNIDLDTNTHSIYSQAANKLLKSRKESYNSCESISLYDADGRIIASSNSDLINKDDQSQAILSYMYATQKPEIGIGGLKPILNNGKKLYAVEIGSPIMDISSPYKRIIGYVVSTIRVSYFDDFLNFLTFGKSGHGFILDNSGIIIHHPDQSLIGTNINHPLLSDLVSGYFNGEKEISGNFVYKYDNSKYAYAYCIIPDLKWILFVKQDISELHAPTLSILLSLIFICIILLLLSSLFANRLAKRFSAPIIALRDAMQTASNGTLSVQTNIKSKNEFGELSTSFNKMMNIINTNYADLATMHEKLLLKDDQLRANYDRIEFLAYHDTLTMLPNKLALLNHINSTLTNPDLIDKIHAVYFVDLDNFKTVNDTLGHEYGDILLTRTAQILSSMIGENGMLARAGGDEFLLFQENIVSKEEATNFASKIIEAFRNPLDLDGESVYISLSIGIALYPENGTISNNLIKNADIAMYKSKDTGKNKYTIFNNKMEEELNRNTLIIEILRTAIINKEIYIQYQPMFDVETDQIIGCEALMRIRNERLGNIGPDEFIPIAEETGMITELSTWLIKEACLFNKKLIEDRIADFTVAVNISSVQINTPGFIDMLSKILEETGLPAQNLELEITEITLVSSITDTTQLLSDLQALGVRISLDDFGTGYSSLNYLTKLPINTLKIDKSFIYNICMNEKDAYVAEAIIQLAHNLNIRVIAEGVEYEDQLSLLKSQNCDIIQGFLFSASLSPSALIELIKNTH